MLDFLRTYRRLKRWLKLYPVAPREQSQYILRLLTILVPLVAGMALFYGFILILTGVWTPVQLGIVALVGPLCAIVIYFLRRQRARQAAITFSAGIWVILVGAAALSGGASSPSFQGVTVTILLAGLLLGRLAGLFLTVLTLVAGSVLLLLEYLEVIETWQLMQFSSLTWGTAQLIYVCVSMVLLYLFLQQIEFSWHQLSVGKRQLGEHVDQLQEQKKALLQANRSYELLSYTNKAINQATNELLLWSEVCSLLVDIGGYQFAWVGLAKEEEGRKVVVPVGHAGFNDGYLETITVLWDESEAGRGPTGVAVRTGEPQIVASIGEETLYEPWRAQALERGYASSIALPLTVEGEVLGALNIYAGEVNKFDKMEVDLLTELADDVAQGVALLRARAGRVVAERERAQYAQQLEALQRMGIELSANLHVEGLLESIAEQAVALLSASLGGFYLYKPEDDLLVWRVAVGPGLAPPGDVVLRRGEGVSGRVLARGEPIIVDDYLIWDGKASVYENYPWRAVLAVPVHWGDEVLGVLNVMSMTPFAFSDVDASLLSMFALQGAIAIHNARLYDQAQQEIVERKQAEIEKAELLEAEREQRVLAETLADIYLALTSTIQLDDVFAMILDQMGRIVSYKTANIALLENGYIRTVHSRGYEEFGSVEMVNQLCVPITEFPLEARVIETKKAVVLADVYVDERWVHFEATAWIHSFIAMPICLRDEVIGILRLDDDRIGHFSEQDAMRLVPLTQAAAIALDNAGLIDQLQQRNHELGMFYRISKIMLTISSYQEGMERVLHEIQTVIGFELVLLELLDDKQSEVKIPFAIGLPVDVDVPMVVAKDEIWSAELFLTGQAVVYDNEKIVGVYKSYWGNLPVQTFLSVPLFIENKVTGALSLGSVTAVSITPEFLDWVTSLSNYIALLLEKQRVEEAMWRTQKLESLGLLASGVAHDFNNLLTAILTEGTIAQEKLKRDDVARRHVQHMTEAAEQAAGLTRQMLAYSGKGQLQIERISLNQFIQQHLNLLFSSIGKQVTLALDLADELPYIVADAGQIQQILMNLTINAAEAYAGREGVVYVKTFKHRLTTDWYPERGWGYALSAGDYVCLAIRDEGVGMDSKVRENLFDPFFTTKFTGRGLGLAAVLGIVRGHKGYIEVKSKLGEGTVFTVYLPAIAEFIDTIEVLLPEKNNESIVEAKAESMPERTLCFLIVDDEAVVRYALADYFELQGWQTFLAENGEDGLAMYIDHQDVIDLILLDMTMPVMSGPEMLAQLSTLNVKVPVIFMSGYSEKTVRNELKQLQNSVHFVQKPFVIDHLLQKIKSVLNLN